MDKIPFLGDIDDELQYSQSLELWIVQLLDHLIDIQRQVPHGGLLVTSNIDNERELIARIKRTNDSLKFVVHTLGHLLTDMTERRKRLADLAVGLTDSEVDEEGP